MANIANITRRRILRWFELILGTLFGLAGVSMLIWLSFFPALSVFGITIGAFGMANGGIIALSVIITVLAFGLFADARYALSSLNSSSQPSPPLTTAASADNNSQDPGLKSAVNLGTGAAISPAPDGAQKGWQPRPGSFSGTPKKELKLDDMEWQRYYF